MGKLLNDGMSHLQAQSHIPLNTWRKWCDLLKMNPREVVRVWDQICYPIMIATSKLPEITYILQMRTHRLEVDIKTFKTETARVLHFITFLYNLKDERLTQGKIKTNLLKFYRVVSLQPDGDPSFVFGHRIVRQLCALTLFARVLKGNNVTLSGVLNLLGEKQGDFERLKGASLKAAGAEAYGEAVRECLEDDGYPPEEEEEEESEAEPSGEAAELDPDSVGLDDLSDEAEFSRSEAEAAEKAAEEAEAGEVSAPTAAAAAADADEDEEEVVYKDPETRAMESFLLKFKTALHAIYEAEAQLGAPPAEEQETPDAEAEEARAAAEDLKAKLLDMRLRAIASFDPLGASIPTVEEAQQIARKAEIARAPKRVYKSSLGGGSSSGGGGSGSGGGGGGGGVGASAAKAGLAAAIGGITGGGGGSGAGPRSPEGKPQDAVAQAAAMLQRPKTASAAAAIAAAQAKAAAQAQAADSGVDPADVVEVKKPSKSQFSDSVRQIATILATIEKADQVVWSLFLDPGAPVKDLQTQARTLVSLGTGATQAYQAIKDVAQLLPLKQLVAVREQVVQKGNFITKVTPFINTVTRTNKALEPTDRLVSVLPEILDNASAALLRLEVLRFSHTFAREEKEGYTRQAVTDYAEKALQALTNATDREVLGKARSRADSDADTLIEIYAAQRFAEGLVEACRGFAAQLVSGGIKNVDQAKAALAGATLDIEGGERDEARLQEFPEELKKESGCGKAYDTVCQFILKEAWAFMRPIHSPAKVAARLQLILREELLSIIAFKPETKRHVENAEIPLLVVGLDKVTSNTAFVNYFVRVREDGNIVYVQGFGDGTFVDLYELREYKDMQMFSEMADKKKKKQVEMLQPGHKYLFTVARINRLAGSTNGELLSTAVLNDEGNPKIFPTFE